MSQTSHGALQNRYFFSKNQRLRFKTGFDSVLSLRNFILFYFLLLSSCLNASQTCILSYRAQVKDAVVISQSFHFTQAMQDIQANKGKRLRIYSPYETDLNTMMQKNRDEIIDFLMKQGVHTRSHEKINDFKSSSLISITIPPTYVTVDFKNDYAIITRLIID